LDLLPKEKQTLAACPKNEIECADELQVVRIRRDVGLGDA